MWDTSFWGGVHYSYPTNGFGAFETRGIHRYNEYFNDPSYGMTCSRTDQFKIIIIGKIYMTHTLTC